MKLLLISILFILFGCSLFESDPCDTGYIEKEKPFFYGYGCYHQGDLDVIDEILNINGYGDYYQIPHISWTDGLYRRVNEFIVVGYNFKHLPSSIGNLDSLWIIAIYETRLEYLPSSIGDLTNLTHLEIFDSKLKSLPSSIGNLSSIERISLLQNQLTSIPSSIGNLSTLRILSLGDNQLTGLPATICDIEGLNVNTSFNCLYFADTPSSSDDSYFVSSDSEWYSLYHCVDFGSQNGDWCDN